VTRLLVLAGLVMIFYPSFLVEVGGLAVMLLVLGINFGRRRREQRAEREGEPQAGVA
jgi:hypothetical protein